MRAVTLVIVALLAARASATPENWEVYKNYYNLKPGMTNFNAGCKNCHTEVPQHNVFGKDVNEMMRAAGAKRLTPAILAMLDSKDSDGDGWPNGVEARQGFLPGDPNSHPAGMPPNQKDHTKMMGADMNRGGTRSFLDEFVPLHSFHPLIIHFPIALFLFGAALEFFGWRKKVEAMRQAGWYCVLFGALSAFLAIPTGLMVFYRSGFQWSGNALIHPILAVSATLLMTATVLWRRKAAHESYAYFALLLLTAALVAATGHFGGQIVYRT